MSMKKNSEEFKDKYYKLNTKYLKHLKKHKDIIKINFYCKLNFKKKIEHNFNFILSFSNFIRAIIF